MTQSDKRPDSSEARKQLAWDMVSIMASKDILWMNAEDSYTRARLLATSAPHSRDWLLAIPISSCGLHLDDEAIRIEVGLRLGCKIREPRDCICGKLVDARGSRSLLCKHGSGRLARHHSITDLIHHALIRANIPFIKEPKGLLNTDNKRPDGFTLIPWQVGRNLTCDVSIVNTIAASYIQTTSVIAGGATEISSERKIVKYVELSNRSCFWPLIFETFGPINDLGLSFLDELGHRIADCTEDARETAHLLQRISGTIQHFNSILFRGSFACCFM